MGFTVRVHTEASDSRIDHAAAPHRLKMFALIYVLNIIALMLR
jgi:hypothetical protein